MFDDRAVTLGLWELDHSVGYPEAVDVALGRRRPPDLAAAVTSSAGDVVRVRIARGAAPARGALVYLERHGAFTLEAAEEWPPLGPGSAPRTLATLRAWPSR